MYTLAVRIHLLARVFYFPLRPLDAEETCVGKSKGAAAVFVVVVVVVVGNTCNNAAGLPAGHTDTSGRGSESGVAGAVAVARSRSHKMGRSVKGKKGCAQKPQQKSGNLLYIMSLQNVNVCFPFPEVEKSQTHLFCSSRHLSYVFRILLRARRELNALATSSRPSTGAAAAGPRPHVQRVRVPVRTCRHELR